MPGDTIFEAARAAGIGGNISTNRAVFQACRIWRIIEPAISHLALEIARNHAGLNDGHTVGYRDLFDPVHSGQRKSDPTLYRNAAAYISEPGSARGYRNLPLIREAKQSRHLVGAFRLDDHIGQMAGKPFIPAIFFQLDRVLRGYF